MKIVPKLLTEPWDVDIGWVENNGKDKVNMENTFSVADEGNV
jgi:hypothetical protein